MPKRVRTYKRNTNATDTNTNAADTTYDYKCTSNGCTCMYSIKPGSEPNFICNGNSPSVKSIEGEPTLMIYTFHCKECAIKGCKSMSSRSIYAK